MSLDSFYMGGKTRAADLARAILTTFLLTFITIRSGAMLILSHKMPDIYQRLGGTWVLHPNYGIVLLAGVGAYLLLGRPTGGRLRWVAALYGLGLALTFDEFGMWLYLGGSYWQRAGFDVVIVVVGLLMLIVVAPVLNRFSPQHWAVAIVLACLSLFFAFLIIQSTSKLGRHSLPRIQVIEAEKTA